MEPQVVRVRRLHPELRLDINPSNLLLHSVTFPFRTLHFFLTFTPNPSRNLRYMFCKTNFLLNLTWLSTEQFIPTAALLDRPYPQHASLPSTSPTAALLCRPRPEGLNGVQGTTKGCSGTNLRYLVCVASPEGFHFLSAPTLKEPLNAQCKGSGSLGITKEPFGIWDICCRY